MVLPKLQQPRFLKTTPLWNKRWLYVFPLCQEMFEFLCVLFNIHANKLHRY